MQQAIIDSVTRIIISLTTDPNPSVPSTMLVIPLATPIDLAGGPYKLDIDNQTLLQPTQNDIDTSGVDDARNAVLAQQKLDNKKIVLQTLLADKTVAQSIKDYLIL